MVLRDTELREASFAEARRASIRSRPVSASISSEAKEAEGYFLQPDQLYELIDPTHVHRELVSVSVDY